MPTHGEPTWKASFSKSSNLLWKEILLLICDILVEMGNIVNSCCLRSMPLSSFCWNWGRVEKMRQRVETTTNMQDTTATTWSRGRVRWYMLATVPHLGSAGVVGILKQVPEPPLHPRAVVVPKLLVQIIILNTGTLSIEIVYIEVKVGELYRKCFAWLVSDFWSNFIFLHTYMIQLDYIYSLKSLKFFTTLRTF